MMGPNGMRSALAASLLFLAACGGGGGDRKMSDSGRPSVAGVDWLIDPASARALTGGGTPPEFSSNEIKARVEGIRDGADTLLITDLHYVGVTVVDDIDATCQGTVCVMALRPVDLANLTFERTEFQAVLLRHGVTVGQTRATRSENGGIRDTLTYGAWLDHSAFSMEAWVVYEGARDDGPDAAAVGALSFGDATGTPPVSGVATWTGVMTGADVRFLSTVQADAAVTVDFGAATAAVAFTNVQDLDNGVGLAPMRWDGLAIASDGKFGAGNLNAAFYGPNHEEIGGVFQRDDIVGAFGAKRN